MTNSIGLDLKNYDGAKSTLCIGCGHNQINAAIAEACYEAGLPPHKAVKISGIGCSSKGTAYFMAQAHGFNGLHGRMPSVATGAYLAAGDLQYIGISGDGDTASIGIGQFVHALRYNPKMLYLVYDNGCYGLTKGQNSATTDLGSSGKYKAEGLFNPVDLVEMALSLKCGFVARAFAGDKKQLVEILKAAMSHNGLALIDIISPCVSYNNTEKSTKSYWYTLEHRKSAITHDVKDYNAACAAWREAKEKGAILTGIVYINPQVKNLHETLSTVATPLREIKQDVLCPGNKVLQSINERFK